MKKHITLVTIGLIIGIFVTLQAKSFKSLDQVLVGRDSHTNVFQEIQILLQTNENLEQEISDLKNTIAQLSNRASALEAIEEEISKYRNLDGQTDISGAGLYMEISDNIESIWLIDLVNELFANGAESVSVNDIRLTDYTHGFDTLPQGQILFNGTIVTNPILIKAIGPADTLKTILEQPKGIIDKLYEHHSPLQISIVKKDVIEMSKVI
jgi:uncharacterized protein YlxW (UPF0749 family)